MNTNPIEFSNLINSAFHEKPELIKTEKSGTYKLIWNRNLSNNNTINCISIEFLFDMESFLAYCSEKLSEFKITEELTMNGIRLFFIEIAPLILVLGKQNYQEIAKFIHKKKGTINGDKFNI